MRPGQVASIIQPTADSHLCPDSYAGYPPQMSNGEPQSCSGGAGNNSWYGRGIVNALSAITHTP
jgi:hypothetical protein